MVHHQFLTLQASYIYYCRNQEEIPHLYYQGFKNFQNKRDPYAFGLGKRNPYAFGLGKRDPYAFGLGKRLSNDLQPILAMAPGSDELQIFGLTKRGLLELGQRKRDPYAFGLGK